MSSDRNNFADLPADARARIDAARAYRDSPAGRAELERVRAAIRQDFPPLAPDPEVSNAISALRAERERQGLSLREVADRTHLELSVLAKLESGTNPAPTFGLSEPTRTRSAKSCRGRSMTSLRQRENKPGSALVRRLALAIVPTQPFARPVVDAAAGSGEGH